SGVGELGDAGLRVDRRVHELRPLVDGEEVDVELSQEVLEAAVEQRARLRPLAFEAAYLRQGGARRPQVVALDAVVEGLGDGRAGGQDRLQGGVEPAVDGALEELGGDGEEEEDGDQRHADVGGDELELEGRAEDAVTALDEQLEEVAQEEEEDGQDEDDV